MHELAQFRWSCWAPDLRGHGASTAVDMRFVSMLDYLEDIKGVVRDHMQQPPVLIGWSMGGLLAAMAAEQVEVAACIMLAPSPPKQALGEVDNDAVDKIPVLIDPRTYGIDPADPHGSAPLAELPPHERVRVASSIHDDSGLARRERKRGIPVGPLGVPALLIAGEDDAAIPLTASQETAKHLGAELLRVPDTGHWGLVLGNGVPDLALRVDSWLRHRLGLS